MRVFIFAGPSINAEDCRCVLPNTVVLPPAAAGDLYRASCEAPDAIALCDGYFDHRLSVWHKEILWALSQGIRVYGAASIGALRAAELEMFGMIGAGRIFEQFRDGLLEDDDEVAVIHESAERGYKASSEALVNIRATLELAEQHGIVSANSARRLVTVAKTIHYADRNYKRLVGEARHAELPDAELVALERFLRNQVPVNQKRLDAITMLQRIQSDFDRGIPAPAKPNFRFENTSAWVALKAKVDRELSTAGQPEVSAPGLPTTRSIAPRETTDPAASAPARTELYTEAVERALALELAEQANWEPAAPVVQARSERFRRILKLESPQATHAWLQSSGLDIEGFSAFIYDQVRVEQFRSHAQRAALAQLAHAEIAQRESPHLETDEPTSGSNESG